MAMAIAFLYTCTCGRRFKAYVPKNKLFRSITGSTVDWERIDRKEQDAGGIEEVKRSASFTQSSFVDVRGDEQLTCPSCRHEVNLMSHFRSVMMNLSHPPAR
jgi:hypothetical protein